jgi:WD40 repeat protein
VGLEGKNFISLNVKHLMSVGQNANQKLGLAFKITEAANFAIYFTGSPAALSTPHLYISSLATWFADSTLSQQWKNQFPHIPSFTYLKAWDIPLMVINTGSVLTAVAISSDGTHIVSGSEDRSVQVWDASSGAKLKVLKGHIDDVTSVAFSSDGTCIVSGSHDMSVQVWDVPSGAHLKVLNGHTDYVTSVAFSSDGTCIVSGSRDKSVQVWDASSGAQLKVLNGHTHHVTSVAFSSDGTHIVSGSKDESVRVWDVSSGAQLMELNGHTDICQFCCLLQ